MHPPVNPTLGTELAVTSAASLGLDTHGVEDRGQLGEFHRGGYRAVAMVLLHGATAVLGGQEGPAVLRLACYQAANTARTVDPQLDALYRQLMTERGHAQADVADARNLVERVWTVISRGQRNHLRDPDGEPITARAA